MMLPNSSSNGRKRRPAAGSRAHQQRSIPTHIVTNWNLPKSRLVILAAGIFCLGSLSLLPILLLESLDDGTGVGAGMHSGLQSSQHVSVGSLLNIAQGLRKEKGASGAETVTGGTGRKVPIPPPVSDSAGGASKSATGSSSSTEEVSENKPKPINSLHELEPDMKFQSKPVARGVAGRPLDAVQTRGVTGAVRAHVDCPELSVDSLAYWNDPVGDWDVAYTSPYRVDNSDPKTEHYISFSPDRGGWNNVRMSMEIIFVLAAVTGRTLVLPPKEPMYLLHHDSASRHRGFADFFPLQTAAFQSRVKVISFAEFLEREGGEHGRLPVPEAHREAVTAAADHCEHRKKVEGFCGPVFDYLDMVGHAPNISASETCLVFDEDEYKGNRPSAETQEHIHTVCGKKREVFYWSEEMNSYPLLHVRAGSKETRLLTHFYGMMHFTNVATDHYYKRFVRDFLHYHDSIYCAAGKIVKAVQAEGVARGFVVDDEGAGAYSAMHVRRGDLQYKRVKIPAQEWYDNTKEVWEPNEILYIATDERNKTFFDDLAAHHTLRYLDDYWEFAGLGDLDPNYMGMIDTIVASRGRAFAGTWFSTFSGYINRLRGYHGMSMKDSWYSFLPKKTAVQQWNLTDEFAYAYEWPDGWIGIDADAWPTRDVF
jgi:hypothetical protein